MVNVLKKSILCLVLLAGAMSITEARSSFDCQSRLTDNFQNRTLMINFEYDRSRIRNFGRDYLADAIAVVRLFIEEKGCSKHSINFGHGPRGRSTSRCRLIERYSPHSRVCYIETNLGYFLLSKNLESNAQITFNLWD